MAELAKAVPTVIQDLNNLSIGMKPQLDLLELLIGWQGFYEREIVKLRNKMGTTLFSWIRATRKELSMTRRTQKISFMILLGTKVRQSRQSFRQELPFKKPLSKLWYVALKKFSSAPQKSLEVKKYAARPSAESITSASKDTESGSS
jgi:hypothetical protein